MGRTLRILVSVALYSGIVAVFAAGVIEDDSAQFAAFIGGGVCAGALVGRPWGVALAALWLFLPAIASLLGNEPVRPEASPWVFIFFLFLPLSILTLAVGVALGGLTQFCGDWLGRRRSRRNEGRNGGGSHRI